MQHIEFPKFTGLRCLMMPYIQGEVDSIPSEYHGYADILNSVVVKRGDVGYLTIDESVAQKGRPHRGTRAKTARALHTEAGRLPGCVYAWGGGSWGGNPNVVLSPNVRILLANSVDQSCALWDATHYNTSRDGDIGNFADMYPYSSAVFMKAGDVHEIGILTPHESLPMKTTSPRQFLRIVSSGVFGREPYFTTNPLCAHE